MQPPKNADMLPPCLTVCFSLSLMEGAYQTLPRRGFGLFIALRLQNADVGEIAVVICVIEAVADDELVRDLEAAHIGLVALGMARRLVQERDRRNGCGVPCAEELTQVLHGEARIDDVLDDDDMAAVMLLSRSLMRRTTPVDCADAP